MKKTIYAVLMTASLAAAGQASAALLPSFQNGGFEGYTGNKNTWNSDVPPGWTTTSGTPDVFNANTTFQDNAWAASSTGGDFLHGIGFNPVRFSTESALQVGLPGLVIGQQYEISFEQSITNNQWSSSGGYWDIVFGDETQSSNPMELPDYGTFGGWEWQTMIFTATAEVQTLEVIAMASVEGGRADLGIDSFFLGDPGTNPNNPNNSVPLPTSLALLGIGLAGLRLQRGKKNAQIAS